jgi:hypothetical protein
VKATVGDTLIEITPPYNRETLLYGVRIEHPDCAPAFLTVGGYIRARQIHERLVAILAKATGITPSHHDTIRYPFAQKPPEPRPLLRLAE